MTGVTKHGFVALLFALYAILVIVGAAHHEPWADEAQAWLVARDNSWLEMQWKLLRYEGSPGLWHTMLYIPAHLGLPYETSIAAVAAAFAITGVAVFLRYSPLPLLINVLVPFTFFVLYQYAVVARSYCLLLLLLSLAALFLETWRTKPLRLVLVLILLSHASVHGALLSLAFIAQVATDMVIGRKQWRSWPIYPGIAAIAAYALNGVVLVLLLWGPSDLTFAVASADMPQVEDKPGGLLLGFYYAATSLGGYTAPAFLMLLVFGLGVVTLIWMATRGTVFGVVAAILLSVLAGARHFDLWHGGILFLAWLFGLWITWARCPPASPQPHRIFGMMASVIVGLHVFYGFATLRQELSGTYSGARDAATYLKERMMPGQTLWAYDFATTAISPYFDRPIFANDALAQDGKSFFLWSTRNANRYMPLRPMRQRILCESQPDFVITLRESRYPKRFKLSKFAACGYEVDREFPGTLFFEGGVLNEMTYILLRRHTG